MPKPFKAINYIFRQWAVDFSTDEDRALFLEAADHIERLEERCMAYKGQVKAGSDEIDRLRLRVAQLEESNQVYEEDSKHDERVINDLRSQLAKAESWKLEWEANQADLREMDRLREQLAKVEGDYSHLEECNKVNMAEAERLHKQLAKAEETIAALEKHLREATKLTRITYTDDFRCEKCGYRHDPKWEECPNEGR